MICSSYFRKTKSICSWGIVMAICIGVSSPAVLCDETPIVYYDMTPLFKLDLSDPLELRRFYDETLLVASLQGLVNRHHPQLYIRYIKDIDDFWWARMTEENGWLYDRKIQHINQLSDLLSHLKDSYRGVVVWDETVPATSNIANTIAGCDDLLSIRYDTSPDSLYQRIVMRLIR